MNVDRRSAQVWASWFRCLSDPSRILLLHRLAVAHRPMTVGELVEQADIGQSTVSHHLAVLAETGFVLSERQANTSRYSVNEKCLDRFPSAAELIMGRLPRYEPGDPDCSPPWCEPAPDAPAPRRRRASSSATTRMSRTRRRAHA